MWQLLHRDNSKMSQNHQQTFKYQASAVKQLPIPEFEHNQDMANSPVLAHLLCCHAHNKQSHICESTHFYLHVTLSLASCLLDTANNKAIRHMQFAVLNVGILPPMPYQITCNNH
jgi:hypothetical protein